MNPNFTANMEKLLRELMVYFYDLRKKILLRRKARAIYREIKDNAVARRKNNILHSEFFALWKDFAGKKDTVWLDIYFQTSGISDPAFVPETIYYTMIEPRLNNKFFSKAYTDKNFYYLLLREFNLPECIAKNVEGVFYDKNNQVINKEMVLHFLRVTDRFIIKPAVDSGGGRDVKLCLNINGELIFHDGTSVQPDWLLLKYGRNYLVQKVIDSHPFYARFNPASINTIRVLTYRSVMDEKITILHSLLRVGKSGSITDNQASGGYACQLTADGKLTGRAVNKTGKIFSEVNGVFLEPGLKMEGFNMISETAVRAASFFPYARLLGMDLCLDNEGRVRLIEVNDVNNEINFFQMLNGPLFAQYTKEVIDYCRSGKKTFIIDFEI